MERRIALVLALSLVVGLGPASGHAAAPTSRIVFAASRTPIWYGEIYRMDANGARLDLSRSPAPDLDPSVSPDGTRVAFLSGRGGTWAYYVVGIDGRGLRRLSPALFPFLENGGTPLAQIAWSPDGKRLAIAGSTRLGRANALYLADLHGGWRQLGRDIGESDGAPAWSPDGTLLAYATSTSGTNRIQVVSPIGKRLWRVTGNGRATWTTGDRLVAPEDGDAIHVYDRWGRIVAGFAGQPPVASPDGSLLASVSGRTLQVRRGGVGKPILTERLGTQYAYGLQWAGPTRLVLSAAGWAGFDVVHRRPVPVGGPAHGFGLVASASGSAASIVSSGTDAEQLDVFQLGSTASRTVAVAPWCNGESFASLAAVPHRSAFVYQSGCGDPPADLYSVAPDGSGLRQLTETTADELEPSLSPDGSTVAYVRQRFAERCDGCARSLWRMPSAGGAPQQLTAPDDNDPRAFHDSPSWSPDGTRIAFTESGTDAPFRLFTIPAAGGAAQDVGAQDLYYDTWGPQLFAGANFSTARLTIETFDPASGAVHTVATGGKVDVGGIAWSPDGRLAYLSYDANGGASIAVVGSAAKPIDLVSLLPPGSRAGGLAWSPDGTRLAFLATDADGVGEVYTIGADGKGLVQVTKDLGAVVGFGPANGLSWR